VSYGLAAEGNGCQVADSGEVAWPGVIPAGMQAGSETWSESMKRWWITADCIVLKKQVQGVQEATGMQGECERNA
jgi:hypothetical protein